MADKTGLKMHTLGTVAANKPVNSNVIEVTLDEQRPMMDGELTSNVTMISASATNAAGAAYSTQVATTSTAMATWLPLFEPNRQTAPDVRRGERVMIWRYVDVDRYYWTTTDNDLSFRKGETVVFAISATMDESAAPDHSNCYTVEYSSHKRLLRIKTTTAMGEPHAFDLVINAGEGYIKFQDDIDNSILLNSIEHQVRLENTEGSFFDITRRALSMFAEDSVHIKTRDYTLESETQNENSGKRNISTEKTSHDGPVDQVGQYALTGNMTTKAGAGGTGEISMSGDMKVEGSAEFSKTVHAQQVISEQPIVAPNIH